MTISERIFFLLKEMKLSKAEFSRKTGISRNTITDWEKKGSNPASDRIACIAEQLMITADFLLTGKESPFSPSESSDRKIEGLTEDENQIIEIFRSLDLRGRTAILSVVFREQDKCVQGGNDEIAVSLSQSGVGEYLSSKLHEKLQEQTEKKGYTEDAAEEVGVFV